MEQTTSTVYKEKPHLCKKKKKNEYSGLCIYRNRVWKKPHLVNYLKNMSGISMSVVCAYIKSLLISIRLIINYWSKEKNNPSFTA